MPVYKSQSTPKPRRSPLFGKLHKLKINSPTLEVFISKLSKMEFTPKQRKRVGEYLEIALVYYSSSPGPL